MTLKITGMSCAACAAKIEKRLGKPDGVIKAAVNLATEKATVELNRSKLKVSDVIAVISALGYGAEKEQEISPDRDKEQRDKEIKRLRRELIISAVLKGN